MERGILTYCSTISPSQCDGNGHLNVQHYAAIFDSAVGVFYARCGMSWRRMGASGLGTVAAHQATTFLGEVRSGDAVECRTRLSRVGTTSLTFEHILIDAKTQRVAARLEAVSVLFGLETRTKVPIPDNLRAELMRICEREPDSQPSKVVEP
ncbi:acyl-CoA thioesterase [Mesorhizobium ciceri]|uniref:acyl-CoA thioesterase n=1 Tax=Mesorhizobium TaxID=68287 RepID=UPI00067EE76A|nr:thioesterase family protein [Mesorhizobium ciceri]